MAEKSDDKDEAKAAAGRLGAVARAESLSPDQRKQIARTAAVERWSADIPRAVNEGPLQIGDIIIECAVIDPGIRLINQESFLKAIGRSRTPKAGTGSASRTSVDDLPPFLAAENIKPFVDDDLRQSTAPILYRTAEGRKAFGYNALLLPKVCDAYLKLRDARKDLKSQKHVIDAAYRLMRGLAQHGIIALVDKATGFDQQEQKREMLLIVQKYVAPELQPWLGKFPPEFWRELYRLRELPWTGTGKHPQYFGHLINKYIYDQLPPGVQDELRRKNPVTERGYRKHKHYQYLTGETGIPHLDDQIKMTTMLMRISESREQFEAMFDKAFAKQKRIPFAVEQRQIKE
ncbi:MAG TPA: P63C domain-containing protein [Thermoanaerobaculia bacterium]|jgi:hypothetical protein|nr:P63C domain-containing protein [Thermoanaerobaculia bacterium]